MRYRFVPSLFTPAHANSLEAFIPEVWAQESLLVLEENMVISNLVNKDFSSEVAAFGDTVNTRSIAEFEMARKTDADEVTTQNAEATNIPVVLNQHNYSSFIIKDGEESKGFQNLREKYLVPAVRSIARGMDQLLLAQVYQFKANNAGSLGTAASRGSVLLTREVMNINKAPLENRNFIITPGVETNLLDTTQFIDANTRGDDGSAMREANIGRLLGFDFYMAQNCPAIADGNTVHTAAVNLIAGYAADSTSIAIDGTSEDLVAGSWCTIGGDMIPQKITTVTGSPTTLLTISPGLKRAVVNDAVVTVYAPGAVDLLAGYAANWSKPIVVDGFSVAPKAGQLVSFDAGASKDVYGTIGTPTTTSILLDRPLVVAEANDDVVGIGPAGDYCFAFHPNAMTLVSRPLAAPAPGTGAASFVADANGLGIRVTITYQGYKQGHLVTVDMLCGVKVLDTSLGAVMFA